MDNSKEGGSINRPPILDDTNYDYWKACMVDFSNLRIAKLGKLSSRVGNILLLLIKMEILHLS